MNRDNPCFVTKKAGELIPEALLQKILDQKPTSFGYVIRDIVDGKPEMVSETLQVAPSLDQIMSVMTEAKDFEAILTFGDVEKLENVQPYELQMLNEDGTETTIIAFAIDADLPKYPAKDGVTEHGIMSQNFIIPLLQELFTDVDGDMSKMVERMNRDTFKASLLGSAGHYSAFSFLPIEGDSIVISNNAELGEAYDWGYASQKFGYGDSTVADQEPAPVAVEAPKKRSFFKSSAPATATTVTETKVGNTTVKDVKTEVKSSVPASGVKVPEMQSPPASLSGKALKRWYQALGGLPKNWQQKPPVPVKAGGMLKDLKDLPKQIANVTPLKKVEAPITAPAAATAVKAPLTTVEKENRNNAVASSIGAVLTADSKKKAMDFIVGRLDNQSNPMMAPNKIQEMESKSPTFSEAMGMAGLEDIFKWDHKTINQFVKEFPDATVLLVEQMRRSYMNFLAEKVAEDTVAESQNVQVPAPSKRSFFKSKAA
jgi:hypothetical protein